VVDALEMEEPASPVDVVTLWRARSSPLPPRPPGRADTRDLGVRPGGVRWVVSRWAPGSDAAVMHHTDTIDLDVVLAGSINLLLDDGPHQLDTGDCAVITGVDHGWRAGPDGCTLSVLLLGTPPLGSV
jgi:hypothetical protein